QARCLRTRRAYRDPSDAANHPEKSQQLVQIWRSLAKPLYCFRLRLLFFPSGRLFLALLLDPADLVLQDAAYDGDRAGVGRVHAKVGEAARAEIFAARVGGIRRVVQDAQFVRQAREIDIFPGWITQQVLIFIDGVEVRAALHLHNGEIGLVVEVQILAVLQEGSFGRDGFLIIQDRAVDQVGLHLLRRKAVIQPIRVLAMFIHDNVRDHHVANAAVERGRLAKNVDAANLSLIFHNLAHHAVCRHTQRIIDVQHNGLALSQQIYIRHATARIDLYLVQFSQLENLGIDLQAVTRPYAPDAALLLLAGTIDQEIAALRGMAPFASDKVEEVLPIARHQSLLELATFIGKIRIMPMQRKID